MSSNSNSQISISPLKSLISLHQDYPILDNLSLQYSHNTTSNHNVNDRSLKSQDLQSQDNNQDSFLHNSDLLSISKSDSNNSKNNNSLSNPHIKIEHYDEEEATMNNNNTNNNNNNNQNSEVKEEVSNLLISFSNISELDPKLMFTNNKLDNNNNNLDNMNSNNNTPNINISDLSGSVICNKDKSDIKDDKDTSLLCNYYLHSNNNTPLTNNINNNVMSGNNNELKINQCNLNNVYNNITISNSAKSKKTPIKYTKSQLLLKNEENEESESNKKNLLLLFNESNISGQYVSNIDILDNVCIKENEDGGKHKKEDVFQVENLSNVEYLNEDNNDNNDNNVNKDNEIGYEYKCNDIRNYSNFSFDITKQVHCFTNKTNSNNSNSNSNNIVPNITNNNTYNNVNENNFDIDQLIQESNYVSPKFNGDVQSPSNVIHIYSTNPNTKNIYSSSATSNNTTIKHVTSNSNSNSNTHNNSHIKFTSSFNLINQYSNANTHSNTNNKLKKHSSTSSLIKTQFPETHSKLQALNTKLYSLLANNTHFTLLTKNKASSTERRQNTSKPKSTKQSNSTNKNKTRYHSNNYSNIHCNSNSGSRKLNTFNNDNKINSTIAFIQNLKPLSFLHMNDENNKITIRDLIKLRPRLSPSPSNNKQRRKSSGNSSHNNSTNTYHTINSNRMNSTRVRKINQSKSPLNMQSSRKDSRKSSKERNVNTVALNRKQKVVNDGISNLHLNYSSANNSHHEIRNTKQIKLTSGNNNSSINSNRADYNNSRCVNNTNPNNKNKSINGTDGAVGNDGNNYYSHPNSTIKKPMKVIQNFSKYKKKSEINSNVKKNNNIQTQKYRNSYKEQGMTQRNSGNQIQQRSINTISSIGNDSGNHKTNSYQLSKNKPIIMKKLNKIGGDQEANLDDI